MAMNIIIKQESHYHSVYVAHRKRTNFRSLYRTPSGSKVVGIYRGSTVQGDHISSAQIGVGHPKITEREELTWKCCH